MNIALSALQSPQLDPGFHGGLTEPQPLVGDALLVMPVIVGVFDFQFDLSLFSTLQKRATSPRLCKKMPGLDLEDDNNTTTRLLTLLNVSALKSSKRQRTESTPRVKLNKRRSVELDKAESASPTPEEDGAKPQSSSPDAAGVEDAAAASEDVEDDHGMRLYSIGNSG